MKAVWRGRLKVSIFSLEVRLFKLWREKLKVVLLCKQHLRPVHYKKMCEEGEELSKEDIVRGIKKGERYIPLQEVLEALSVRDMKEIRIEKFHKGRPKASYIKESFLLSPAKGVEKEFTALLEAMKRKNVHGLGTIIYRGKIRPISLYEEDDALILSILHYREERLSLNYRAAESSKEEVALLESIIEKMEEDGEESLAEDPLYAKVKNYLEIKETHEG